MKSTNLIYNKTISSMYSFTAKQAFAYISDYFKND